MQDILNIVNSRSYKLNVVTVKVKDLQVIRVLITKKRFFENINEIEHIFILKSKLIMSGGNPLVYQRS